MPNSAADIKRSERMFWEACFQNILNAISQQGGVEDAGMRNAAHRSADAALEIWREIYAPDRVGQPSEYVS